MNGRMVAMDDRLQRVEAPAADSESGDEHRETERKSGVSQCGATRSTVEELATPDSLRMNLRLMAQAAKRLAKMEGDEGEDDSDQYLPRNRGKKSGSLRVGTDSVKHTIDWPHMHVRCIMYGKQKTLAYAELKVEEFIYRFLTMLKNPECKMDNCTMLKLLPILMQDAMDYTWSNSRNYWTGGGGGRYDVGLFGSIPCSTFGPYSQIRKRVKRGKRAKRTIGLSRNSPPPPPPLACNGVPPSRSRSASRAETSTQKLPTKRCWGLSLGHRWPPCTLAP